MLFGRVRDEIVGGSVVVGSPPPLALGGLRDALTNEKGGEAGGVCLEFFRFEDAEDLAWVVVLGDDGRVLARGVRCEEVATVDPPVETDAVEVQQGREQIEELSRIWKS